VTLHTAGPGGAAKAATYNQAEEQPAAMSKLQELADRIERLVLRHEELKRTRVLLEQQLGSVSAERDSLRSRLAAARSRIDALLERLPVKTEERDERSGNKSP
jgi:cell division protein ZapB